MRLTLTQRLLLSTGTVLAALLVAGLVSLHSASIVRERLTAMVQAAEPLSDAAYEMEINLGETALAVKGYLNGHDAQALALFSDSIKDFEYFHGRLVAHAVSERQRAQAARLDNDFRALTASGRRLIEDEDRQAERLDSLVQRAAELDGLLDAEAARSAPAGAQRRSELQLAATQMEANSHGMLQMLYGSIVAPSAQQETRLADYRRAFDVSLAAYRRAAGAALDPRWANEVGARFDALGKLAVVVIENEKQETASFAEFLQRRRALDDLLDEELQPGARALYVAAQADVLAASERTASFALAALGFALVFGIAGALLTVRSMRRSLSELAAAAESVALGNFSRRVQVRDRGQLASLAESFNKMAAQRSLAEQALRESHTQLEIRVQERTTDLQAAIRALEAQIAATNTAQQALQLAAQVFDNTADGIAVLDARDRTITAINQAFTRLTGYSQQDVIGRPIDALWSSPDGSKLPAAVWETVTLTQRWQGETRSRHRLGALQPVWSTISPARDAAGAISNYIFVFSDIGDLKAAEHRLDHLAHYDPLTQLPNRLLFYDRLDHALARARRSERRIGLLYLDLDRFKIINDTLGHSAGDRLLQAVSARLKSCLRADDTVSRIGGDEFTVIVEDLDSPGYASLVAEKILAVLVPPIVLDERNINIAASIGIGLFPDDAVDGEALVKSADMAMYLAKGQGGGSYRHYTHTLTERIQHDAVVEDGLRAALVSGGLELHYQPLVATATRIIIGAEALLRWRHPQLGWVSPAEVLRVADECGLAQRLGDWVLATACAQAKAWDDAGLPFQRLAVNVSPRQLQDDGFVAGVERMLGDSGLDPALLEIEVTEHSLQSGPQIALRLHQLKALGLRLALDDFGTGYSCLASLKTLPFDRLKIDRSFVTGLIDDPNDRAITTAIIALSKSLGLEVVAEGVETEPIMKALLEHGCREAQGYLFGAPAPAAIFEQRLREARDLPRLLTLTAA